MAGFRKKNLRHIKNIFEEKTGADLNPAHRTRQRQPGRTALILAASLAVCLVLVGFAQPVFSPLNGDELSLGGTYLGDGIVSVHVENRSDKELKFQEQVKLMNWGTAQEVESTGGRVTMENTVFPAHSEGTMTIDLSEAYDVEALETIQPGEAGTIYYYLLLTNQNFLFGQDWMCSFSFRDSSEEPAEEPESTEAETLPPEPVEAVIAEDIEEELRFYFEEAYNLPMAFNEQNFVYQQKVQEVLRRFDGTVVAPVEPMLIVGRTPEDVVFDPEVPMEQQYLLVGENYHIIDGYGRIVAGFNSPTGWEHALTLKALLPSYRGETDGGVYMPLIYLFTYEVSAIREDNTYAFIYGQLLSFAEMEQYKFYEDDQYAVYEVTDLFYTDLDAYIDYFLTTRDDIYFDEQVRQRIYNIYDYFKDKENLNSLMYYNLP